MKRWLKYAVIFSFALVALMAMPFEGESSTEQAEASLERSTIPMVFGADKTAASSYVVIAWNDLGMHCISPSFDKMAILPPYNNLVAQVIKRGNPPRVVTTGVSLEYSIVDNTRVTGKTNFWQFEDALFGVDLPEGIGLTGNGLRGTLAVTGSRFEATGIPVLPLTDSMRWDPYQRAKVKVRNAAGTVVADTEAVLPVSDELNCGRCHSDNGPGAPGIHTGSVDLNILSLHDLRNGTNLVANTPVLCASCHSDNALGMPGVPGVPDMSLAMHRRHSVLGAGTPSCYDCHPGPRTQCNRSALDSMGPRGSNPNCESCHGTLANVALTIEQGRRPWLDEPTCAQCHGASYSTGAELYRNSHGHGGLMCAACHNSPHAWWPSRRSVDNKQPIRLQGSADAIGHECTVCHTSEPDGGGPHEDEDDGGDDDDD